jgi:pyruvate ferredoxin oxidoreductase gamma subunit
MLYEIIWYGRGGQGGVTAANILVYAALREGLYGQGFPFFGAERRGAPVMAFSRISDRPILRHGMFTEADVLVVLDPKLMDIGVVKRIKVRDKGIIVVNTGKPEKLKPGDFNTEGLAKIYAVDATRIALEHKLVVAGWPVVNTGMLGAFSKATGLVGINSVVEAIKEYFPGRVGEVNALAAEKAYKETKLVLEAG